METNNAAPVYKFGPSVLSICIKDVCCIARRGKPFTRRGITAEEIGTTTFDDRCIACRCSALAICVSQQPVGYGARLCALHFRPGPLRGSPIVYFAWRKSVIRHVIDVICVKFCNYLSACDFPAVHHCGLLHLYRCVPCLCAWFLLVFAIAYCVHYFCALEAI